MTFAIQADWRALTVELGSNKAQELGLILLQEPSVRSCPLARLLRLSAEIGMTLHLPKALTVP